jgi:hypothetical protein
VNGHEDRLPTAGLPNPSGIPALPRRPAGRDEDAAMAVAFRDGGSCPVGSYRTGACGHMSQALTCSRSFSSYRSLHGSAFVIS